MISLPDVSSDKKTAVGLAEAGATWTLKAFAACAFRGA
jgi:hypothetical protein